jgi:N6-adenosine-specific RNA methylase IME4
MQVEKRYKIISADPNWMYENWSEKKNGAASSHYKCSPVEEICSIPVGNWAAKDSVLTLWGTLPKLPEALQVMNAWGFKYVSSIPWVKHVPKNFTIKFNEGKTLLELENDIRMGIGFWTRSTTELLLIGTKGAPKRINSRKETPFGLLEANDRVFYHKIGKHSKKPEDVQTWLERTFKGPYLELYSTRQRKGWDCWGYDTGFKLSASGVEEVVKVEKNIEVEAFDPSESFVKMANEKFAVGVSQAIENGDHHEGDF